MLQQPVNHKGCPSIQFHLREFYHEYKKLSQFQSRFNGLNTSTDFCFHDYGKSDGDIFLLVIKIMKFLVLIPAVAAIVQEMHSSLKFIKNGLRLVMTKDRIHCFTVINSHKDIILDYGSTNNDFVTNIYEKCYS